MYKRQYLLTIDDLGDAFIHDLRRHRPIAKIAQTTSPFVGACFVDNNGRLLMLNKAGGIELIEVKQGQVSRVILRYDPEAGEGQAQLVPSTNGATSVSRNGSLFETNFEKGHNDR